MNPQGIVTGGWNWVVAVYAFTWIALCGYALSLWWRSRRPAIVAERNEPPPDDRRFS